MIIAVIDLGTNTFNLLIRNTLNNQTLFNDKISVRLGDGGINDNIIAPAPFQRGIEAIANHLETCKKHKVKEVYALATSAIRSANNKDDFTQAVFEKTGVHINIIDGDKEAKLIHLGVSTALTLPQENVLIMDIGGGSTEFIIANNKEVLWKESFLIGASRIMEKFRPTDPISTDDIEALNQYYENTLESLFAAAKKFPVKILIGSSGTFDTLAAMVAHRFHNIDIVEGKTTFTFDMYEYMSIAQKMIQADFEERLKTPGMIPMRVDLIVIACLQINFVINRIGIKGLKLSTYALKEGVFYTLKNNNPWQKSLL